MLIGTTYTKKRVLFNECPGWVGARRSGSTLENFGYRVVDRPIIRGRADRLERVGRRHWRSKRLGRLVGVSRRGRLCLRGAGDGQAHGNGDTTTGTARQTRDRKLTRHGVLPDSTGRRERMASLALAIPGGVAGSVQRRVTGSAIYHPSHGLHRIANHSCLQQRGRCRVGRVGKVGRARYSRQTRSNGRRQACGAISWWIAFGPHEPGAYAFTGGGDSSNGIDNSHRRSMPSAVVNKV